MGTFSDIYQQYLSYPAAYSPFKRVEIKQVCPLNLTHLRYYFPVQYVYSYNEIDCITDTAK